MFLVFNLYNPMNVAVSPTCDHVHLTEWCSYVVAEGEPALENCGPFFYIYTPCLASENWCNVLVYVWNPHSFVKAMHYCRYTWQVFWMKGTFSQIVKMLKMHHCHSISLGLQSKNATSSFLTTEVQWAAKKKYCK